MSDAFGLGDGMSNLSGTPGLAESRVPPARRRHDATMSRWPSPGGLLKIIAVTLAAIVVVGWLLTAING